jgi:hypothetical protein
MFVGTCSGNFFNVTVNLCARSRGYSSKVQAWTDLEKLDSGRGTNYLGKITYPYLIEIPDNNVAHMGDNLKGRSIRGHYRLIR